MQQVNTFIFNEYGMKKWVYHICETYTPGYITLQQNFSKALVEILAFMKLCMDFYFSLYREQITH